MKRSIEKEYKYIYKLKRYQFEELFIPIRQEGKTEYYRDSDIWGKTFKENTWSNKAAEELEKNEEVRRKKDEVKGLYFF